MSESRPSAVRVAPAALSAVGAPPAAAAGYLVALGAFAGAWAVRWLFDAPMGEHLPFFTFYFAMMIAAWYGGLGPGLVTVALGIVVGDYFFADPRGSLQIESAFNRLDAIRFAIVGVGVSVICETLHGYRRKAEEREELLRVTLASVGDGVITTDTKGRVTYLNGVAEALTGWTCASAQGQALDTVFPIINEDTRETVQNPAFTALREGTIVALANGTLLLMKDGTERPIEDSASPIRDRHCRVVGCVLIFRDVSGKRDTERELRRREAELRDRHDELQSIYDTTPVGLALLDRNLRFVRVNGRLAEMNGLPAADHIGRTIGEVLPGVAKQLEPVFHGVMETGEPVIETELVAETRARPGVVRTWLESWYPLRSGTGEIVGINAVVMEITDRKRDEARIDKLLAELKDADRRKDEFLATLAHELRGPLAPICNMLEVMKRADDDPELMRQARDTMERQLRQMVRLVDDLLDVGRITRDKLELRMSRVEIAPVMEQAAETCRALADEFQHELVVVPPPAPLYVQADPVRLAQVFSNLLNNACKYTEPKGRIGFAAAREGDEVVATVSDTGIGMAPEELAGVFGMFQVERAPERPRGGLGIGLMLVKRLVEMHGGRVEAVSDGPGRGSTFTVRLPLLADAAPAPLVSDAPAEAPPPAAPRRILVVDDSVDSALSLATLLSMMGSETRTAHDGPSALAAADEMRPDVVLLDIGLPGIDGYEVCRRLREKPWAADVLVIALTGWGQDEDRRRSRDSGFDHHLVKPVDFTSLLALLADATQGRVAR